jgi:pyruvate/2-oxoglutarate dehydrogenase complex dihydrolipoamide dehydrogenase (E3) component
MVSIDASHILVASSRAANLDELNIDAAKIRRSKSDPGALSLSASLRTTNPKVFAVGEAAGQVTHLSRLEADLVVRAALLGEQARYDPTAVPRLTLTDPEIAEIGLTEPIARTRFKTGFSVLRASYAENERARASRDGMGVVKLVISRNGRIIGAGIVGAGAGELLALLAFAMHQNLSAARLADLPAPYPTHADLLRVLGEQAAAATGTRNAWQARRLALNRLLP